VEIVAPCLNAQRPDDFSNLEECLFAGDEITETAVRPLADQYERETDFGRSGVKFSDWPKATPYRKLGLNIRLGYYGGTEYDHEFLRKLRELFPESKYRDVFAYRLLPRGYTGIVEVTPWIEGLEAYRQEFPNGRYFIHATNDLAHAYDNLWDILKPGSDVGYYEEFSSGNRARDTELAEEYRQKALTLYEAILTRETDSDPQTQRILQSVRKRYPELVARRRGNEFYILND